MPCLSLTLFSFLLLTGRYLLPNPVAGQAWPPSAETSNLVRMRSQALGQSAPSLTASLVSVLCVVRIALVIASQWSVSLLQANHRLGSGHAWFSVCQFLPSHPQEKHRQLQSVSYLDLVNQHLAQLAYLLFCVYLCVACPYIYVHCTVLELPESKMCVHCTPCFCDRQPE